MKPIIILQVGAESGSITLLGDQVDDQWRFRLGMREDSTESSEARDHEWVDTWEEALTLLDKYPWHALYPFEVSAEFAEEIYAQVVDSKRAQRLWPDWEMAFKGKLAGNR